MCNKGNPSTVSNTSQTTNQSGNSTTTQTGNASGQQAGTQSAVLGPTPETLALYMQLLGQAQGIADPANLNPNTLVGTAPWTDAMNQAINAQYGLGQQGMGFVPEAAGMLGQGGLSTIGQIPGVAASMMSPWAGQAVNFGLSQGQAIGDFGLTQGQAIGDFGLSQGQAHWRLGDRPSAEQHVARAAAWQFSKAAIEKYESPYTEKVVDATQDWFNNQNAIQGNQLIGQGIKQGNVFGGDRAGVAQGILAGQQQLAQAPVIAGLYNQGYAQALAEFNTQNQLAAQLQQFGANLGLQGLQAQGQLGMQGLQAQGQLGLAGLQAQGQLGMSGLGLGLNAATAANQQAIGALGQNQSAALQAGQLYGNLGATQYNQNLAGGQQAIGAATAYPAWLQNLMNQQAGNAGAISAYPFQSTSWYGGLLGGLGPLTGTQSAGSNASASQQQQNQIANMISQQIANQIGSGTTTPPQPNQFVQAAGLGLSALGMFLKDGGAVPRMAEGGGVGPYGGKRVPYSGSRSYIQDSGLRPGRLKEPPNSSDKPLTLQSLGKALQFMNLSNVGSLPKTAAGVTAAANSGTLGQLSSLLKSEGAKGAAGALSSFFGSGGGNTAASSTSVPAEEELKRGGMVNRFADGGEWDDDEVVGDFQEGSPGGLPVQAEDLPDEPDPWANVFGFTNMPPGENVPMPRARPEEAGPRADSDLGLERSEYADYFDSLAAPTKADQSQGDMEGGSPAGLPEQAGLGNEEAPAFGGGRGGQGGRGRMLVQGTPRSQPGFLQRWASNPLTQIGLGLASQNSPTALGGIGQGLAHAMPQIQRQRALDQQQEALDRRHQVDNSGMTQLIKFADGRIWDTGLATPKALQMAQTEAHRQRAQRPQRPPTAEQAATQKFLETNPDATAEDIADFNVKLKSRGVAGKAMPHSTQKDLATAGTTLDQLDNLSSTFKPDYAGFKVQAIGEVVNKAALAGLAGEDRKQAAEWWQTYDRYKADIRHGKFGASLTKNEQTAWNALDVNPGMDPSSVAKNMQEQQRIIDGAVLRNAQSLAAQGYSQKAIEAQIGVPLEELAGRVDKSKAKPTETSAPEGKSQPAPSLKSGETLKPMPPEIAADARTAIPKKGRDAVVKRLREMGYDPSGL